MSSKPGTAADLPATAGDAAEGDGGPPRHALLLTVCCIAQFMVILDISIVNVALPTIQRDLGFSTTDLQWVINAYTITFAGFLMLSGRVADLFGQRRTFVTGLTLFGLASLAGGTAGTQELLVAARALQGLGGAIMAAASLAIITSSYAPGPERHRAIGLWGAMNGAGGATGTLLGGVITEELSWRWVLLINLPIGIATAAVASVVVSERRRQSGQAGGFDLGGALAITGGLLSLVYGIVNAGSEGWGAASALGPIALGLALLALFVLIEARLAPAPLVPLRVFASRSLRSANIVVLLFSAALFPMWFLTSLYLQKVLLMPPLGAGLAFLPMALTIMACATRAGPLVARFGARAVFGYGLIPLALGMALFAALLQTNGSYGANVLVPGLLVAIGIGFAIVPATIVATTGVKPTEAGLASGLINTARQMGGALGLAILASVAAQFTSHLINSRYQAPLVALTNGFRLAYLVGALFAAAAVVATFRLIPRSSGGAPAGAPTPAAAPDTAGPPAGTPDAKSPRDASGTSQAPITPARWHRRMRLRTAARRPRPSWGQQPPLQPAPAPRRRPSAGAPARQASSVSGPVSVRSCSRLAGGARWPRSPPAR